MQEQLTRTERQNELQELLDNNPFLTDEECAERFGVSVQTIRLDRMSLGIPEMRQRTREVARQAYGSLKALGSSDIVGELLSVNLGQEAMSVLVTDESMVFERTEVVRSHYILAQADSLALALVDADVALTGLANVKYRRPVRAGEKLVARARVLRKKGQDKFVVLVQTTVNEEQVFRGKFVVFVVTADQLSNR